MHWIFHIWITKYNSMMLSKISRRITLLCLLYCPMVFAQVATTYKNIVPHFQQSGDSLKFQSASFISAFVKHRKTSAGNIILKYDTLFPAMQVMREARQNKVASGSFSGVWNYLVANYGRPELDPARDIEDTISVSDDFLIRDIDLAYNIRKTISWKDSINQDVFNEFVLPYRVAKERLEPNWRMHLFKKYDSLRYTPKGELKTVRKFVNDVQRNISRNFDNYNPMWSYPFDIPISKMEQGRLGSCTHLANYTTAVMRAIGLPTTVDFTLLWGNNRTGHMWNVIILPDGKSWPFDAGNYPMGIDFSERQIAKIFRQRNVNLPFQLPSNVPDYLYNESWQDVTQLYTPTIDIKVAVPKAVEAKLKNVMLGTFDNRRWVPQSYAAIESGYATFRNMGRNCIYITMSLDENNVLSTFGEPFLISQETGLPNYLSAASEKMEVRVVRKYRETKSVRAMMGSMVNCEFIASADSTFSDPKSLFLVSDTPQHVTDKNLDISEKFRFVKLINPNKLPAYIGEIEFFKGSSKIIASSQTDLNSIDGNPSSYVTLNAGKSLIYDLGTATEFNRVRYVPRSDTNFILEDNRYQLCVWKDGAWEPFGEMTAKSSELVFSRIPKDGLYLLHNLTQGKEERIFTYQDGKQIWY